MPRWRACELDPDRRSTAYTRCPQGKHPVMQRESSDRDRGVRRVIIIEGSANAAVLALKLVVGFSTGSLAIIADAVHSLTDLANNVLAWAVVTVAQRPADREHPYGHRKFETLAVFGLATLLAVLAVELALHAVRREQVRVETETWGLVLMIGVLAINVALAVWERRWARRLKSDILLADASHTFADVLMTSAVIVGWQLSAGGLLWLDTVCALVVAALVAYLAFGLYRRVVPVLVDRIAVAPEPLMQATLAVDGVRDVKRLRSRAAGSVHMVDVVVTVDPTLSTSQSHDIAESIEVLLESKFGIHDVMVHVEPAPRE